MPTLIKNNIQRVSESQLRDALDGNRSFRQRVSSPTTSSLILKSIRQRQNTV